MTDDNRKRGLLQAEAPFGPESVEDGLGGRIRDWIEEFV